MSVTAKIKHALLSGLKTNTNFTTPGILPEDTWALPLPPGPPPYPVAVINPGDTGVTGRIQSTVIDRNKVVIQIPNFVIGDLVPESFTDDGKGNMTSPDGGTGTIDYFTGDVSLLFGKPHGIAAPTNFQVLSYRYNAIGLDFRVKRLNEGFSDSSSFIFQLQDNETGLLYDVEGRIRPSIQNNYGTGVGVR